MTILHIHFDAPPTFKFSCWYWGILPYQGYFSAFTCLERLFLNTATMEFIRLASFFILGEWGGFIKFAVGIAHNWETIPLKV